MKNRIKLFISALPRAIYNASKAFFIFIVYAVCVDRLIGVEYGKLMYSLFTVATLIILIGILVNELIDKKGGIINDPLGSHKEVDN